MMNEHPNCRCIVIMADGWTPTTDALRRVRWAVANVVWAQCLAMLPVHEYSKDDLFDFWLTLAEIDHLVDA
jgi:hypothetical protein